MEQERSQNEQIAKQAGITIESPNIDISLMSQEDLDRLLRRKEKQLLASAPMQEDELSGVKIRSRKQALSTFMYTIKALEEISKFNDSVVTKEKQLTEALRNILQSDSKIK